jgi:TetR/AcrR family transcriptional regulator, cholesterol catabolism regulator
MMNQITNISRRRDTALQEGSADYLAKRAELVEIAARQFKTNGFRATTLASIGRKAGLDRSTVYYYFASKEEVFRECVLVGVEANVAECARIAANTEAAARERLSAVIDQLMKAYDHYYPHMYVYIQEEMNRVTSEKSVWAQQITGQTRAFERIVMGLIAELIDNGEMRGDIPVSIAANAIFGMLNWTHRWYQPGGPHPAAEVSGAFCAIFYDGMANRKL